MNFFGEMLSVWLFLFFLLVGGRCLECLEEFLDSNLEVEYLTSVKKNPDSTHHEIESKLTIQNGGSDKDQSVVTGGTGGSGGSGGSDESSTGSSMVVLNASLTKSPKTPTR